MDEEEGKSTGSEDPMADASRKSLMEHPVETSRNPCKFPDLIFGLLWISAVISCLAISIEYGTDIGAANYHDADKRKALRKIMKLFLITFFFALIVAQILLHIMMRFGGSIIHVSFLCIEILLGGTGIILIKELERWFFGCFFLVLCLLTLTFHCMSFARIRNAAVTLHVGCAIVLTYPILQLTALLFSILAVGFFFLHTVAILAFYNYKQSRNEDTFKELVLPIFILIFLSFWSQQVLKYIVIATSASTAQAWWQGQYPSISQHPALNGLARNCTYNLGAISFGAVFVSIIETIVLIIQYFKRLSKASPGNCCLGCFLSCIQCCLVCCEAILDYINKYAFVYVGIWGYSYLWAGKQVVTLFAHHGFVVVGADFFIDFVFFMNSFIIGLVSAGFGILLVEIGPNSWDEHTTSPKLVAALVSGIAGLFIGTIVFSVVDGANKSVMVLFSENPHVLEITHPDEFKRLSASWSLLGQDIKAGEDSTDDSADQNDA
uniref:Choline transporter-like protein n=1 Tax=Aureoumbra lagunensis TaxID=44058 RepID=A0A7S3JVS1_9STRA|mmetsp:Transcript_11820/g.17677  ORF Transcript_11820/g.17677 Transcript_11820/m.17677 type:complete len:492 (-) Transcript_11820:458-1933(-)